MISVRSQRISTVQGLGFRVDSDPVIVTNGDYSRALSCVLGADQTRRATWQSLVSYVGHHPDDVRALHCIAS